jgi:uncharacterized membrane protein
MDIMELVSVLSRWLHVGAGILWIGLLYWFNFVNIPFGGTMDGDTKKKVVPELIPRALYWFRWGAAYTWITGIILLALVFYHGGLMYGADATSEWTMGQSLLTLAILIILVFVYDFLAKSGIGKNIKVMATVGFILTAALVYIMAEVMSFDYRAYVIHIGVLFGSIMAFNVWFKIWPAQKKVIPAVKEGTAPDSTLAATAMQRSRHNTFLSLPLFWTMINMHTTVPASSSWLYLLGAILLGWLTVSLVYKKSAKITGM